MLSVGRRILYRIVNPRIVHDKYTIKSDSSLPLYPIYGMKETKTGIMILNKPDNNNNVTQQCADELFRFLTTYHHDHNVENVWLENKGSSFSGGADLQALVNNPNYLDKLMRLSIFMGQFNKPIFAKVQGSVRGIGAYLLSMISTPLATETSSLRLDETAKGFVPIFGGSWRLSRLPCNIGLYLALTGDSLDSDQMGKLGFLKGKVRDQFTTKKICRHLSDANLFMREPYTPSSHSISQIRRQNLILFKKNYFYELLKQTQKQLYKVGGNFSSKMALTQHRRAMTQYHNTLNPYNSFSDKNLVANNYYAMRHDRPFNYLKKQNVVEQGKNNNNNLIARLPVAKLIKVFNRQDIKGVLEQLKNDGSQWAKKTEQMIRAKDPLALNLTFQMIKNAKSMPWVQCLQQEYKIARRVLTISKPVHKDIANNRSLIVLENKYSKLKPEQITKQTMTEFFRPPETELQIFAHDTPNYSFFPTADYWRQIPDAGRNYLNQTFFQDIHARYAQIQVPRFLNTLKIDYRDSSYNIAKLRQYLYKKFDYERLIQLEKQRIRGIFQSDFFYNNLKQKRIKYLDQKLQSPQLSKIVSQAIKEYFDEKFTKKFEQLQKTSKIAGKQSRMQILRKYVNVMTNNIVFKGRQIQQKNRLNNARHEGLVRFDEHGSDIWTAEGKLQKNNHELNVLKNAYINGRNVQNLKNIDPSKPKPQNFIDGRELTYQQYDIIKRDAALRLNYNNGKLVPQQIARKYRNLMQKAAKTSQQITEMLGWQNKDIQNIIISAPKKPVTFRQFAQQTLVNASKVQQRIQQMNRMYDQFQKISKFQVDNILKTQSQSSVNNLFFDTKIIPRPFRQVHLSMLENVLKFYSEKYQIPSLKTGQQAKNVKKSGFLQQWSQKTYKEGFSKLMRSDVEYTFSYLVVLHLKQILSQLQTNRPKGMKDISSFLQSKFGINITQMNFNQFNQLFMSYLYSILDLHQASKNKIIFPQTKMIEFLNRFKINAQSEKQSILSFESLMLLIARDRKRVRDMQEGIIPLLGYDPQVNLNTLITQQKENDSGLPKLQQWKSQQHDVKIQQIPKSWPYKRLMQLDQTADNEKNMKKLIMSYPYYLRRFQAMLQRAAGDTMFLPKSLYEYQGKKIYEQAKQLLKIQLNQQQWFKLKLKSVVKHLMDFRYDHQKDMTQGELRMFDEQFSQLFTPEILKYVIMYDCHAQQVIARDLINDNHDNQPSTNDSIDSKYLDIKGQIKNHKSLRLLNNLLMSENVVRKRMVDMQFQQTNGTGQQTNDLNYQYEKNVSPRTYQRLLKDSFRLSPATELNQKNLKTLSKSLQHRQLGVDETVFMDQLKQINQLLEDSDLRSQLEDRIKRISTLYRD